MYNDHLNTLEPHCMYKNVLFKLKKELWNVNSELQGGKKSELWVVLFLFFCPQAITNVLED